MAVQGLAVPASGTFGERSLPHTPPLEITGVLRVPASGTFGERSLPHKSPREITGV